MPDIDRRESKTKQNKRQNISSYIGQQICKKKYSASCSGNGFEGKIHLNPLSPDIKMHILITDLHTFLMKLVRRICLNINTSYPQ